MRRKLLAGLLTLHALAHSAIGDWVSAGPLVWLANLFWSAAMVGYLFAAFGVLGMPVASARWREALMIATVASILLLVRFLPLVGLLGIVVDVAILGTALEVARRDYHPRRVAPRPRPGRLATTAAGAALVYVAAVSLFRPVYRGWDAAPSARGPTVPSILGLVTGPVVVFVYEPASFISQRRMAREASVPGAEASTGLP